MQARRVDARAHCIGDRSSCETERMRSTGGTFVLKKKPPFMLCEFRILYCCLKLAWRSFFAQSFRSCNQGDGVNKGAGG